MNDIQSAICLSTSRSLNTYHSWSIRFLNIGMASQLGLPPLSLLLSYIGNKYKDQARIVELESLLGQAHAEIELLKKAFAMTQKKVREGRIKPMQRDDLRPSMKPFMMAFRYCRVPKLFRTYLISELEVRNMKLNKRKIHGIIREKKKGLTTSEIARDMKISRRRVQQVWKTVSRHRNRASYRQRY